MDRMGWSPCKQLVTGHGLHFRGVLCRYLSGRGVQVHTAPLEAPEAIGHVERHGGIAKAMYKKVCAQTQCHGIEQAQISTSRFERSMSYQGHYCTPFRFSTISMGTRSKSKRNP